MKVTESLLNSWNMQTVEINGRSVCNEEAAMVFESMPLEFKARFQGLSDLKVIESVYALFFDYGFTNTHGVEFTAAEKSLVCSLN